MSASLIKLYLVSVQWLLTKVQLINCELKQGNIYLFVIIFFQKILYHDSINKKTVKGENIQVP